MKLFCHTRIEGRDNLPSQGPFILAANHPSYLDPPLVATATGLKVRFLAKSELFAHSFLRFYFHHVGAIGVKRHSSDLRALRRALAVLRHEPLLVFPQGLRGASFDQVHGGVGFLAKKSGVPVIAVRVYGSDTIFLRKRSWLRRPRLRFVFAKVSDIDYHTSHKAIAAQIMATIQSL